jgi:hypothetical protein
VGVAELAELLSVSKQRASELARKSDFPRPVSQLASGPIWRLSAILRYSRQWRRQPGRPKKRVENETVTIASESLPIARDVFEGSVLSYKSFHKFLLWEGDKLNTISDVFAERMNLVSTLANTKAFEYVQIAFDQNDTKVENLEFDSAPAELESVCRAEVENSLVS